MRLTEVFAPAKINLTLHVTGLRSDGYHLLDSLVTFAPVGDRLTLVPAPDLTLSVSGPESAGVPEDRANLVLRAAALVKGARGAFTLDKVLPPASGIGGGASDAAAALRALGGAFARTDLARLGADIPMCLTPAPQRARGIGEDLSFVTLPHLPALLVNPRVQVPTPAVFKALTGKANPPMPAAVPGFSGTLDCIGWLATRRNDLQAPAIAIAPVIGALLDTLAALPGARLARMSGSGATCFALFATMAEAETAAGIVRATYPGWWIAAGLLGDQTRKARPICRVRSAP